MATTAAVLMLIGPASAADCPYLSERGDELIIQPGSVHVVGMNGDIGPRCTLKGNGPGNPIMTGICDDGRDWALFSVAPDKDAEKDIIIFMNQAWYHATCQ